MIRDAEKAGEIVRDAGGRIVGRTRLQKLAYLLSAAGLEDGFEFEYRHYGPFSESLASAARTADLLGILNEVEQPAQWGGAYSVYTTSLPTASDVDLGRRELAVLAAEADAVELELAATAVFLAKEGFDEPWAETARRKPEKAGGGRLKRAMSFYEKLRAIKTPVSLPET